jgi:hypothetical protein
MIPLGIYFLNKSAGKTNLISSMEIIKKGTSLYIKNFKKFLLPLAIIIPINILDILLTYLSFPGKTIIMIIVLVAVYLLSFWINILFIDLINKIYTNQGFDINILFKSAFYRIPSYLFVCILAGLIIIGGFFLFIIPGIIFSIWFGYAAVINIIEEKNNKGRLALLESRDLVRGRLWATFWRQFAPPIIFVILGLIISAIIVGPLYMLSLLGNLDPIMFFMYLYTFIILVLSPLFVAFEIILYCSLKETKKSIIQY